MSASSFVELQASRERAASTASGWFMLLAALVLLRIAIATIVGLIADEGPLSMIPVAVLVYGLINARRCFAGFAAGEFFSLAAADRLRNFAIAVAASSLLEPLSGGALSVLLSINGLSGPRTLRLEIGSETLIMMIFAGTVAIIAWLMAEAAGLAEENEQFV